MYTSFQNQIKWKGGVFLFIYWARIKKNIQLAAAGKEITDQMQLWGIYVLHTITIEETKS